MGFLFPAFPWPGANSPILSHSHHVWLSQNINLHRYTSPLLFSVDENILARVSLHLLLPPLIKRENLKRNYKEKNPQLFFLLPFHAVSSGFPSLPSHKSGSSGVSKSKCVRTIYIWVLLNKKSMFYTLIFSSHIKPPILRITRVINAESDFVFLTLIYISTSNANNCDIRLYKNYQVHQLCLIKPFKSCFCYI